MPYKPYDFGMLLIVHYYLMLKHHRVTDSCTYEMQLSRFCSQTRYMRLPHQAQNFSFYAVTVSGLTSPVWQQYKSLRLLKNLIFLMA